MDKKIIYSEGNIVVIVLGKIYSKSGVTKDFVNHLQELSTIEEIEELMLETSDTLDQKIEKVTKEKYTEFVAQEVNKILTLNKDPKRYYLYEDKNNNYKLALDLLLNTENFKKNNYAIIGNLSELFNNRLAKVIENRIKEIL